MTNTGIDKLPEWLSVKDVAHLIGVKPGQIRKWVKAGQFQEIAVFNRRLIRISLASYQQFMAKYKVTAAA